MITDYYRNLCAYFQSHSLTIDSNWRYAYCGVNALRESDNFIMNNISVFWVVSNNDERMPFYSRCGLKTMVGSGTTEPTATDIKLETSQMGNIINYTETFNTTAEDGKLITTVTITGTNKSSSEITLTEVFLYKKVYTSTGNYTEVLVPVTRELLQTPITVPPNKGFTLTFEWVDQ